VSGIDRRAVLRGATALGAGILVSGCVGGQQSVSNRQIATALAYAPDPAAAGMYGPVEGERFPISAIDVARIDPRFLRQEVDYPTAEAPGTIVIDPAAHYLYLVEPGGRALRYGVGVGREGFAWSGTATINSKQEWPDWYPTPEMIERRPDIPAMLSPLQSGMGIPGGLKNPIGARGLYLWQDGKDTLYRIHGTTEPYTIGQSVSSGCIRMINQDVMDLYGRVEVGTQVKVLPVVTS
jgi:lipoprotein-anchoring transpeptidase ErfK/SrfK